MFSLLRKLWRSSKVTPPAVPEAFAKLDLERMRTLKQLGFYPKCIYDIGSSDTCWSTLTHNIFPDATYHLFEPLSDYSDAYRKYIGPMLESHPNFTLHKFALGKELKPISIFFTDDSFSSTTLNMDGQYAFHARKIQVEMRTLEHCIEELGMPVPQMIKIDAQGSELDILIGFKKYLRQVDVLFLECWLTRGYGQETPLFHELCSWLTDFGFHVWDFTECWRDRTTGVNVSQDCIFMNKRCDISALKNDCGRIAG